MLKTADRFSLQKRRMPPHRQRTTTREWRRLMLRQKPHVPRADILAALTAAHLHQLPAVTRGSRMAQPHPTECVPPQPTTGTFPKVHITTLACLTATKRLSPICKASGKQLTPAVTRRLKHSSTRRPKPYALSTTTPET